MVNLISRGTGHVIDPATHAEQMRQIRNVAAEGLNPNPKQLRFVTWTLKYNRCHWLEVLRLTKHYERAEFRAQISEDVIDVQEVRNMDRFAVHRPVKRMRIAGEEIPIPRAHPSEALTFGRTQGVWRCEDPGNPRPPSGKRHGLQGPIDDAFAAPFLCVRGTGTPWNADVHAWATNNLRRFEYEWPKYMRGDLPVKNDTEVTETDVRDKNLILFGDPGSNPWIARALPQLPLIWSRDEVHLGGRAHSSKHHVPVLICDSPLASDRYLVINSGHTFHENEFAAFNYLLFPRLGDWAVIRIKPGETTWQATSERFSEEAVNAGYYDEDWSRASVAGL